MLSQLLSGYVFLRLPVNPCLNEWKLLFKKKRTTMECNSVVLAVDFLINCRLWQSYGLEKYKINFKEGKLTWSHLNGSSCTCSVYVAELLCTCMCISEGLCYCRGWILGVLWILALFHLKKYLVFVLNPSCCSQLLLLVLPATLNLFKILFYKIFLKYWVFWSLTRGLNILSPCAFWISNLFDIGDVTSKCILICWINIWLNSVSWLCC